MTKTNHVSRDRIRILLSSSIPKKTNSERVFTANHWLDYLKDVSWNISANTSGYYQIFKNAIGPLNAQSFNNNHPSHSFVQEDNSHPRKSKIHNNPLLLALTPYGSFHIRKNTGRHLPAFALPFDVYSEDR